MAITNQQTCLNLPVWAYSKWENTAKANSRIVLPKGLNSSSKIFAISGIHKESVTVMNLLPVKAEKDHPNTF